MCVSEFTSRPAEGEHRGYPRDVQDVQVSRRPGMAESDQRTSLGRPFFSSIFFRRVKKMDPWSADGTALNN